MATLKQMIPDDKIEELKEKHGEVTVLTAGCGVQIVVRNPNRGEYQKFRAEASGKLKDSALENLVRTIILEPDRNYFHTEILARWPGICEEFAEQILELVGISNRATAEKR